MISSKSNWKEKKILLKRPFGTDETLICILPSLYNSLANMYKTKAPKMLTIHAMHIMVNIKIPVNVDF